MLPAHPQANLAEGIVFAVAGIGQAVLAVAMLTNPTRRRVLAAAAVSLAVIAVWVLARTTGLPGPNPWLQLDTAVGFSDLLYFALEALATLLLGWAALRWPRERRRSMTGRAVPGRGGAAH